PKRVRPPSGRLSWSAECRAACCPPGARGTLCSLRPGSARRQFAAAIGTAPLLCYGALLPFAFFGWVLRVIKDNFPAAPVTEVLFPLPPPWHGIPTAAVWAAEVSDPLDASVDQQHDSCDPQGVFDPIGRVHHPVPVSQGPVGNQLVDSQEENSQSKEQQHQSGKCPAQRLHAIASLPSFGFPKSKGNRFTVCRIKPFPALLCCSAIYFKNSSTTLSIPGFSQVRSNRRALPFRAARRRGIAVPVVSCSWSSSSTPSPAGVSP
ncbi:Thiamine biosynthesis protein ThiF, partial [Dysosmobacter welbionis]